MSLGELYEHKGWTPPAPITPVVPVQKYPNQYALFLQKERMYRTNKLYPWSSDIQLAALSTDKASLESVVEAWNRESKDKYKDSAVIGGIKMKDNISVIDVTKILKLYIIKIGGVYYYTGSDWKTKVSEALAFQNKRKAEAIVLADKMTEWTEILEIDLDRASFS